MRRIRIVDSHTGGEPTRVVLEGGPDLGDGPLGERLALLRDRYDEYRSAVVNEPRGSDAIVGAWLVPPADPSCVAGVIFFNNAGYLGMCGHGTIGLAVTLAYLGRIAPGEHRIETPVGVVTARLHADSSVSVTNVPSRREARAMRVEVPGIGAVTGDVAWGGNWFYLIESHGQELTLANVGALTDYCARVRAAVNARGYPQVDHIELFGPARLPGNCGGEQDEVGKLHQQRDEAPRRRQELRALSRQRLRPLTVRHRHQRQARLPGRGRQARRRRAVGAGEHHRQRLSRQLPAQRRRGHSHHPRQRVRECGCDAAAR
jgi:4-hydroxyproline epimerase